MRSLLAVSEQADLLDLFREERMARNLYRAFYRQHRLPVFKRIAESEARHADALACLLVQFDVTPVQGGYGAHQATYRRALGAGLASLAGALDAAVGLEIEDIDAIAEAAARSNNVCVRRVMAQLGGGSFNHLRAFLRQFLARGLTTEHPWQDYVSAAELHMPCNLAYKILPLFQAKGVQPSGPLGLV